jgi:hypothetical protein
MGLAGERDNPRVMDHFVHEHHGHRQTGRRHQWLTHSSMLLGEFLRFQAVERVALGVLRVLATTTATHWRRRTRVHGNFSQFETRALPTPSGVAIRVRLVHASGR